MPQSTLVLKLDPRQQAELEDRLGAGRFEFRSMDHARFSARGEGVVVTLYRSGKLVVQGGAADAFAARYLPDVPPPSKAKEDGTAGAASAPDDAPSIGSDEAGKGDYFGPLVVAAVRLEPGERNELAASGVMDSKRLSDSRVLQLAGALEARYAFAVEALDPPEYNRAYAEQGNLNPILADLHAAAIRRLARPGIHVLVDQFSKEELLKDRLATADVALHQTPRAERDMAVAAASVLARKEFLERLAKLSEGCAVELHKGAGEATDRAARELVSLHGFDVLPSVAKVHFKNTTKLQRAQRDE